MSKVGIYSAIYNSEKYIKEMIESIQKQTFQDWELSMVDDGSSDNSFNIASEIAKNDKRISVNKIPHCGIVGKVKNKAISYFKNDTLYCCGVDSDDYIIPQTIEIYSNFLDKHPNIGALCGNFICFNENKKWALNHVCNSGNFDSKTLLRYMNFFPLRFYRKIIYDIINGYSEELTNADDYDLALKIDEITNIIRIKEPVVYYYRQHPNQISSTSKVEENKNAKIALQNALNRRGLKYNIKNDSPPFVLEEDCDHFIWRKK